MRSLLAAIAITLTTSFAAALPQPVEVFLNPSQPFIVDVEYTRGDMTIAPPSFTYDLYALSFVGGGKVEFGTLFIESCFDDICSSQISDAFKGKQADYGQFAGASRQIAEGIGGHMKPGGTITMRLQWRVVGLEDWQAASTSFRYE